jgi:hypothetical protein
MPLIATILLILASLVALLNILGSYQAFRRARNGLSGGYSNVALISLVFCLLAWRLAPNTIGAWALIPTLIDPGTWSLVILPFYLAWRALRHSS